jgi:outer membrane lipoprotein-sorting protein
MMPRLRQCLLLALLIFPPALIAQSSDLLTHIWDGVQQAQEKYKSGCGTVTETRTSKLMVRPMVLHGKFCAEGMTKFMLEYSEPNPLRIRFNKDYLNVTTGGRTEVIKVGDSVRRAQSAFSRENSIGNLKKNFTITAAEDSRAYEMKMVPRSEAFRHRLNYIVVKLRKRDFLLQSLEVDGKSGVNSVFTIDVATTNVKIPAETFEVYEPK